MEELVRFILKRSKFLMFLALEIIAFTLIFKGNDFQKSSFLKHTATVAASCYNVTTSVSDYFALKGINEELAIENTRLKNELELVLSQQSGVQRDTAMHQLGANQVHYIHAKVVYSSIYKLQNFIILDKGNRAGIKPDMGVVFNNQAVGVVQYVTNNYAVVMPLINTTLRVSAKIKRDNQLGTICWNGTNSSILNFEEIPRHAKPVVGDNVVTSGYSAIFPEGYLIGTITKADCEPSDVFYDIHVAAATNFHKLTYVSVVIYDTKSEMDSILNSLPDER